MKYIFGTFQRRDHYSAYDTEIIEEFPKGFFSARYK